MKTYPYAHTPIAFDFAQSIERFFVEEIPLYDFSGSGAYLILKIKKTDMSTWKLIHVLQSALHVSESDIGYAGLKDKSATTIQYISLPKAVENKLDNLITERIEILEKSYNRAPIKLGHLKANRFEIRLDKVTPKAAAEIEKAAMMMQQSGIPNFFGYQRFGEDGKSHEQGKKIAHSGKKLKGAKEKLLVSAYQSHLFNSWLERRIEISQVVTANNAGKAAKMLRFPQPLVEVLQQQPQFFKLFLGDSMSPYPEGKPHFTTDMQRDALAFEARRLTPTGLLCGSHVMRARSDAAHIEKDFDDEELGSMRGDRRAAWVWPEALSFRYEEGLEQLHVNFTLPKGSYATAFLEQIGKRTLYTQSTPVAKSVLTEKH